MTTLDDRYGSGIGDRLRDVTRLCLRAERLAGRGREWYDSDPDGDVLRLAADALVLKLGRRGAPTARGLPPRSSWRPGMASGDGMRHRLAHDYDAADCVGSGDTEGSGVRRCGIRRHRVSRDHSRSGVGSARPAQRGAGVPNCPQLLISSMGLRPESWGAACS